MTPDLAFFAGAATQRQRERLGRIARIRAEHAAGLSRVGLAGKYRLSHRDIDAILTPPRKTEDTAAPHEQRKE